MQVVNESLLRTRYKLLNHSLGSAWRMIIFLVPKRKNVVLIHTFPDFEDTTKAFCACARKNGITLIILTARKSYSTPTWARHGNIQVYYKYSARGFWQYNRTRFIFFTHGLFSWWPPSRNQIVVNLWHGMPLKNIGYLANFPNSRLPKFHYTIAYNENFRWIMATAFAINPADVLLCNHPRNDVLFSEQPIECEKYFNSKRLIVWVPTYRKADHGYRGLDGSLKGNIIFNKKLLRKVNEICIETESTCIIKLHPMVDRKQSECIKEFSNLKLLSDSHLSELSVTTYDLLAISVAIITDVSSVYFDYKQLGRPIILFCPDLKQYCESRGLIQQAMHQLDDVFLIEEKEFIDELERVLKNVKITPELDRKCISGTLELWNKVGVGGLDG